MLRGGMSQGGTKLGGMTKGGFTSVRASLVTLARRLLRTLGTPTHPPNAQILPRSRGLETRPATRCKRHRTTRRLPAEERFGLTAQMRRAAVSITSNIAEGYGRSTRGEYLNHLSFARGSLYELESLCEVCRELSFLNAKDLATVSKHLVHVRRLLRRLIEALRKSTKPA